MYKWLKENISSLDHGLDIILNLRPKTFNFIEVDEMVAGFIAQDINETNPEWVIKHDDDIYITYNDKGYIRASLVSAIQDQHQTITALQEKVEQLTRIICLDHPDAESCKTEKVHQ